MTSKKNTRVAIICMLSALVLWGAILRFYRLGEQALWIDEGYTINASMAIQGRGVPVLDSGKYYTNGTLSTYMVAGTMAIFGFEPNSPWAARIPAAVAGTALIALVFFASRRFSGSDAQALMSAAAVTFMEWEIAFSRVSRGYAMVACFVVAAFIFFDRYAAKRRSSDLLLSLGALVLAMLSHTVAVVVLPAYLVGLLYVLKKKEWGHGGFFTLCVALIGAGAASLLLPFELIGEKVRFITQAPLYFAIFGLAALGGYGLGLFDHKKKGAVEVMGLWAIVSCACVMLFSPFAQFRYLFPVFPFLVMLSSYGLWRCAGLLVSKEWARNLLAAVLLICALAPIAVFVPRADYRLDSRVTPQPDFREAFSLINTMRKPGDVVISSYAPLNKIYFGDKGYWLGTALPERQGKFDFRQSSGQDFYTGAPLVLGSDMLLSLAAIRHGFVVIDTPTEARVSEIMYTIRTSGLFKLVFEAGGRSDLSYIAIYRF